MAVRIDGKALAVKVKARAAAAAAELPRRPGLAVVLVGEDPASQVYVRGKEADCAECGIRSFPYRLPAQTTQAELLTLIDHLNRAPEVDGILVQLPLPEPLEEAAVIEAIALEKDVDCFHPYNVVGCRPAVRYFCPAHRQASWKCCGNTAFPLRGSGVWCWGAAILSANPWRRC